MAGITSKVSTAELIMPPTIGAAIRRISSDPVPVLHRIGSNPAMIAVTVIIFGRTRSTAPEIDSPAQVRMRQRPTLAARAPVGSRRAWSR